METAEERLLKLLHHSGFPFQIGVRKEIERTASEHGWRVSAEEHHWIHPVSGKSGFIDLIVEHQQCWLSLVIECKRMRARDQHEKGPGWIFLTPEGYTTTHTRLSGYRADKIRDDLAERKVNHDRLSWTDDVDFQPSTTEASYCVFESQDEKNPMLERIADSLLPSVESVGSNWLAHSNAANRESRIFVPVIVTNAVLYTCVFDPALINMADGILPAGKFQQVPFVRFRKSLTQPPAGFEVRDFKHSNRLQQRTMLVINSAELSATLKQLARQ